MSRVCPVSPSRAIGGEIVRLGDFEVLIREVGPADGALLIDGFARLSFRSRYARFLTAKRELTPAEVRYFTDVDRVDHDAIAALDPSTGDGVGVARFVRSRTDPQQADVAVTVVDAWQRRGVGTALLTQLAARARRVGIFSFTATVAADNDAMVALLRRSGPGVELVSVGGGVLEYEVALASVTALLAKAPYALL